MKKLLLLLSLVLTAGAAVAQTYDDLDCIITPPSGKETVYIRSGWNLAPVGFEYSSNPQEGKTTLVECEDGSVYLKQPVSTYRRATTQDKWIKGVRNGRKLVFKSQRTGLVRGVNWELRVSMGAWNGSVFVPDFDADIVYEETTDGKKLMLLNTDEHNILGTFYTDGGDFGDDGDWGTILTIDTSDKHGEPACPPDGAEGKDYVTMGVSLGNGALEYQGQVVIVGNEAWLSSFCIQAKKLWIKGSVGEDGTLTFPKEQYIKTVEGYDYYIYGAKKEGTKTTPCDLVLTYDAEHDKYMAQSDIIVTADKWEEGQNIIETVQNFLLFPVGGAPELLTETPEGEMKIYTRSGQAFVRNMGGVFFGDQNDLDIAIVFAPENKVYMLQPISNFCGYELTWAEGKIEEDGKIHVPLYQWVDWEDNTDVGMGALGFRTAVFHLVELPEGSSYEIAPEYNEVTFCIDQETGVIRLDSFDGVENKGDYPTLIYGVAYSDNFQWGGYGDAGSVYTPKVEEEEEGIGAPSMTHNPLALPLYDLTGRALKSGALGGSLRSSHGVLLQNGYKIIK